jgi:hypothetical protein
MRRNEYNGKVFFLPEDGKLIKITYTRQCVRIINDVEEDENGAPIIVTREEPYTDTSTQIVTAFSVDADKEAELTIEEIPDPSIPEIPESIARLRDLGVELGEIQKWFAETDYIPNKVFVGEWQETDERWIAYKEERTRKRARKDEILKEMGAVR